MLPCRKAETGRLPEEHLHPAPYRRLPNVKSTVMRRNRHKIHAMERSMRPHMVVGVDLGMTCKFLFGQED